MSSLPEIPSEPAHPESWPPHPAKKMVMGPYITTIGALLAFFTVVFVVVFLPTTTFEPPPAENWRPLTELEMEGRNIFLANGCLYCHSGFTRPQDVYAGQYYVYSRVSEPGDYMGSGETPNLFGTMRTGPDLSQSGGYHPDDWHYAHYANARYTTPLSVMPSFEFLSQDQMQALVAFTQSRGGQLADLRSQHQENLKVMEMAAGNVAAPGENGDRTDGYPSANAIKNLMLIERGYWFADNPLPVTQQNLVRGRQVFEERCIGCHGSQGNGNGPAAFYMNPVPAAFDVVDDQLTGTDTSPGAYYWRILRGLPGTGMENFGTRLSVDDIWKVVLFLKTIPNGGLTADLPTTDMYIQWEGYPGFFVWAECFAPESEYFQAVAPTTETFSVPTPDPAIPTPSASIVITNTTAPPGTGDVPGIVGIGDLNYTYAVSLWMAENNARPCGTTGFESVSLQDILNDAAAEGGEYARQGADQQQFVPASLIDESQLPPQWLSSVWGQSNPFIAPAAGNQ